MFHAKLHQHRIHIENPRVPCVITKLAAELTSLSLTLTLTLFGMVVPSHRWEPPVPGHLNRLTPLFQSFDRTEQYREFDDKDSDG